MKGFSGKRHHGDLMDVDVFTMKQEVHTRVCASISIMCDEAGSERFTTCSGATRQTKSRRRSLLMKSSSSSSSSPSRFFKHSAGQDLKRLIFKYDFISLQWRHLL